LEYGFVRYWNLGDTWKVDQKYLGKF
jgi:hypothetical protein